MAPQPRPTAVRAPVSHIQRAFDTYCERARELGVLSQAQHDSLLQDFADVAADERDGWMLKAIEEGLKGAVVEVIGATGRHPRGWWGDGSVGSVQGGVLFDTRTPGLVPVLLTVNNLSSGKSDTALVGVSALNLRLRAHAPSDEPGKVGGCGYAAGAAGGDGGCDDGGSGDGGSGDGGVAAAQVGMLEASSEEEQTLVITQLPTVLRAELSLGELMASGEKRSHMSTMWQACAQLLHDWTRICTRAATRDPSHVGSEPCGIHVP